MRVALVHDFLTQNGGAERVLAALSSIWPDAPIYTIVHDRKRVGPVFSGKDIRPSFLQSFPFGVRKYKWFLPWMPTAIERHDLMGYDVVLSSSSAFAKGVITGPRTLHICYCHTPTRYLWTDTHTYLAELGVGQAVKRVLPFFFTNLRLWDQMSASRVDTFIANSKNVEGRIRKYYARDSAVIHPPISVRQFLRPSGLDRDRYFLTGGRLVAYKRFDLVIDAMNRLGIPLVIFGTGPEDAKLRARAKRHIRFLGHVDDALLPDLYHRAQAFLHPQEEDFGLTAIEAMAAGCPVIAFNRGGARETIRGGVTGVFFEEQTWESLADAVLHYDVRAFDPEALHAHAEQFDVMRFQDAMKTYVEQQWASFLLRESDKAPIGKTTLHFSAYETRMV